MEGIAEYVSYEGTRQESLITHNADAGSRKPFQMVYDRRHISTNVAKRMSSISLSVYQHDFGCIIQQFVSTFTVGKSFN